MTTADTLRANDSFEDETFDALDLGGRDLGGKVFADCSFRNCRLGESRWDGARLEDCVFDGCDLTGLVPIGLGLRGVEFRRCKMMGIDWTNVGAFPDVSFADCNLGYCSFVSLRLRKLPFVRCVLTEASFVEADLTEARFEDCQLGTNWTSVALTGVDEKALGGTLVDHCEFVRAGTGDGLANGTVFKVAATICVTAISAMSLLLLGTTVLGFFGIG